MIPVMQTKVVVRNSKDEIVVHGNCYAACIASILELPITEVPNVEVFFDTPNYYWAEVMQTFLNAKGYDLSTDSRFKVFHDGQHGIEEGKRADWCRELYNEYYLVSGKSIRGVYHMVIYQNGKIVHDPHPSKDGILECEIFESITKTPTP